MCGVLHRGCAAMIRALLPVVCDEKPCNLCAGSPFSMSVFVDVLVKGESHREI